MKNERKTNIRVGIAAFAAVLICVWIFAWAKNTEIYSENRTLRISFNNVGGLEVGDLVSVNGVRKGYIQTIDLSENEVLVEVRLEKEVDLREDAVFGIYMLDLMGGKKLEISPGNSDNPIDYDKLQKGSFTGDISTAMAALSSVQNDLVEMIHDLRKTLSSMNSLFADESFTADLKSSVKSLKDLSTQASGLIRNNDSLITNLLAESQKLVVNSNNFLSANEEGIKTAVGKLNKTMDSAAELIDNLNELNRRISNDENNLGKILHDESLLTDLKSSLAEVTKLLKVLNVQLEQDGIKVDANIF